MLETSAIRNLKFMRIIDKYIAKQIIFYVSIVLVIILSIDIFLNIIDELRLCTKSDYLVKHALLYVFLNIPSRMYFLCPWATLLGTLLGLGVLGYNYELVVIESMKISRPNIALIIAKAMLLFAGVMMIIGEVVAPSLDHIAYTMKVRNLHRADLDEQYGIWLRLGRCFIHVNGIADQKTLKGILQFNLDEQLKLEQVLAIDRAYKTEDGWILYDVMGTNFYNDHTEGYQQKEIRQKEFIDLGVLHTLGEKHIERLSIIRLWQIIKNLNRHSLAIKRYESALCSKFMHSINIVIMSYLAVPFAFGILRNKNIMWKFLTGILLSFLYYIFNATCMELAAIVPIYPIFIAILPTLFFLLLARLLI